MISLRLTLLPLTLLAVGCGGQSGEHADSHGVEIGAYASMPLRHGSGIPVVDPHATIADAPAFTAEDIFPCSECHDPDFMETDSAPRELADPHDIMPTYAHAAHRMWCLDCHDDEDRDMLRLASGKLIEFEKAPQLCGQCHNQQHRDWLGGAHGRRTGKWNGEKLVQPCSACHDAHSPLFSPIEPLAGPKKPELTR